jgi:hypothetical protein
MSSLIFDVECQHMPAKACQHNSQYSFCTKCSCILISAEDTKSLVSSSSIKKENSMQLEFDPLDYFEVIKHTKFKKSPTTSSYQIVRSDIIKFLRKMIMKNKYEDSTFHLAMSYIDIILKNKTALSSSESKVDLIVIAAFILASKYAENDPLIPDLQNFSSSSSKYYFNIKEVRKYEDAVLKAIDYKVDQVTSYSVLQFFIHHGIVFKDELEILFEISPEINIHKIHNYCYEILNFFSYDNKSLDYSPVSIALSCIILCREFYELHPNRTNDLFKTYNLDQESVSECVNEIRR